MVIEKGKLVSLVAAAQKGDGEALNELFNAFYNDLYYFALKTVKDDELALDITQEAFVEIINTLGNLKEPSAFVTWAKQITYHQCTRYFKKKKDVLVDEDEDGNTVFDTLKEENAEFIPDEALDKADFKKTILAMLDELSEEQRSATVMYYFDEMSIKQIAQVQGVSEGTVKSRLNYARKSIKNSVEQYEKKHNVKLHALPFFPFFKWLLEGSFEGVPAASAELLAEGVATATGTTITAAASTSAAAAATTGATAAATATTAAGIGAKIAALPIVTKVVAGIVATAVVAGTGATAAILSKDDNVPTGNQSIISSSSSDYNTESSSIIPSGMVYTTHDGTVLKEGDSFPESCTRGDTIEYGDYYYGYECWYNHPDLTKVDESQRGKWVDIQNHIIASGEKYYENDLLGGWLPAVKDLTKDKYGPILKSINGKPIRALLGTFMECKNMVQAPEISDNITLLFFTFADCSKLANAPEIPDSVTKMPYAFQGCSSLTQAPDLPSAIVDLEGTFHNCSALKKAPKIPATADRIYGIFNRCSSLKGDIEINSNNIDKSNIALYRHAFKDTSGINLIGKASEEILILIAKHSEATDITVNGKPLSYYDSSFENSDSDTLLDSLKTEFGEIAPLLKFSSLPYFESTDKLAPSSAFWYSLYKLDSSPYKISENNGQITYVIPISVFDDASTKDFGRTYDYSSINGESDPYIGVYTATYMPRSNDTPASMQVVALGGGGGPGHAEGKEYIKINDTTYQVNITWYDVSSEKPDESEKDWYQSESDSSTYYIAYKYEKMVLQHVNGSWQMVSYTKA